MGEDRQIIGLIAPTEAVAQPANFELDTILRGCAWRKVAADAFTVGTRRRFARTGAGAPGRLEEANQEIFAEGHCANDSLSTFEPRAIRRDARKLDSEPSLEASADTASSGTYPQSRSSSTRRASPISPASPRLFINPLAAFETS